LLIRISDPHRLGDFCDHLSRHGWPAIEQGLDSAEVLLPEPPNDLEAAAELMSTVLLWRAANAGVNVSFGTG
jgi:hypothetical protein